jgi:hypothetical protein
MNTTPLAIAILLLLQPRIDVEPAHQQNQVYCEALLSGWIAGGSTVAFPEPILKDGLSADAQRSALLRLCGSAEALGNLLHDSVTAPFVLKVHDQKGEHATIRIVDLWFVVRGDLDRLDPVNVAAQTSGKAVEAGNMRFETRIPSDDELRPSKRSSERGQLFSRWFVHVEARLLDRIAVEATNELSATRTGESLVIAARVDHAFDRQGPLANRWQILLQQGQSSSAHDYTGGMSYAKISRLRQPEGRLLVEFHGAFSEPEEWFQGAPILRSKFAPVAQDQVRRLRRELLKASTKSGRPFPSH